MPSMTFPGLRARSCPPNFPCFILVVTLVVVVIRGSSLNVRVSSNLNIMHMYDHVCINMSDVNSIDSPGLTEIH